MNLLDDSRCGACGGDAGHRRSAQNHRRRFERGPATIKPSLNAFAEISFVRRTGRRNNAQTVNIYWRRKNEPQWKLLVAKRRTFPFDDQTPLAQPGVPEQREYMARGVIGDDEIGIPSDIVPVLFGG